MKISKRKALLLGLAATTLFGVKGCERNSEPKVYGPPEWFGVEDNQDEDVYGPPIFEDGPDVEDNEPAAVYGPPADFGVEDNELEDVYGPPEWFDEPEDPEDETVSENGTISGNAADDSVDQGKAGTGPDITIVEPDANIQPVVYGPPEWFDNKEDGE